MRNMERALRPAFALPESNQSVPTQAKPRVRRRPGSARSGFDRRPMKFNPHLPDGVGVKGSWLTHLGTFPPRSAWPSRVEPGEAQWVDEERGRATPCPL